VAVPERVLKVAPKKPVGRVALWRLSAAAKVFGQGPCDFLNCCDSAATLVFSGVDAHEVTFDSRAALMRSSWYSGCMASTVNIVAVWVEDVGFVGSNRLLCREAVKYKTDLVGEDV
jgi:hypothetical protein